HDTKKLLQSMSPIMDPLYQIGLYELTDATYHHAPHDAVVISRHHDRRVRGILGDEIMHAAASAEALHHHFAIHRGDDDMSVARSDGTVDDEYVSREDACTGHGVSLHTDKERGC